MKRLLLLLMTCFIVFISQGQELRAFKIYNKEKEPVSFSEMTDILSRYEVVLFGEYHNNAIIHWLELKTTEALYREKGNKLMLGAEMFERDNQKQLNRYLSGEIKEKELQKEARLWPNFHTDYKPLLDFAKAHHLKFIATNIPRRYAAVVAKEGQDSLTHLPRREKRYMAKMPIQVDMATPGYKEMLGLLKDHAGDRAKDFVAAQAVKDATMAASIRKNLKRKFLFFKRGNLFLHFNGDYHSKEYGGIYWYLKKRKKHWEIAVISIATSKENDLPLPEDFSPTDFNIVVPADMTKTY